MTDISGVYKGHYKDTPNEIEMVEFLVKDAEGNMIGMTVSHDSSYLTFLQGKQVKNKIAGEFSSPKETGKFEFKIFKEKNTNEIKIIGQFIVGETIRDYVISR